MKKTPLRTVRYALEAAALWLFIRVFRLLPKRAASNFGGWIGRTIGPCLKSNKVGYTNLQLVFPEKSHEEHTNILLGMWDHLGRVMAEYPHAEDLSKNNTKVIHQEYLEQALNDENGAIFISGHIGNWEMNVLTMFTQFGRKVSSTYRAPNNPWSHAMLRKVRTLDGQLDAHTKSPEGGRAVMRDMRDKKMLGILIDQKYNEGLELPFFGNPAMTNPIFVHLAQKYRCTLMPANCRRVDGCNFEITLRPAIKLFDDNDEPLPVEDVIAEANAMLEELIRECPEQWLWIHRRWKDDVYE